MLNLYISTPNSLKKNLISRTTFYHTYWVKIYWEMHLIFKPYLQIYLHHHLLPIKLDIKKRFTSIYWTFYYNNRPRFNLFYPTYFFTFSMLFEELKLRSTEQSMSNIKLFLSFLNNYILSPYVLIYFNYFSPYIFYIQQLLIKFHKLKLIYFFLPHHVQYFYKYKRYKSIKKWIKKKFYKVPRYI